MGSWEIIPGGGRRHLGNLTIFVNMVKALFCYEKAKLPEAEGVVIRVLGLVNTV